MAQIATILPYIYAAASVASAAVSVYSAFNKPDVKIPVVKIPDADLAQINAAIEGNKALSDQARAAINQNIAMYNEGRLSPQYQAKLDEWWAQASSNLSQRLASAGLENSSVAQSAYNELARKYASFSADLLRQQLSDALSLSGLSQEYINNLLTRTQLELGAQAAYAQSYAQAMGGVQQAAAQRGQAAAGLGQAATGLGDTLKKIDVPTTSPVAGSTPLIATTLETFYSFPPYEVPPEGIF